MLTLSNETPVSFATVSVRSDRGKTASAGTEEVMKFTTCCSWVADRSMATTFDGRVLIASKLIWRVDNVRKASSAFVSAANDCSASWRISSMKLSASITDRLRPRPPLEGIFYEITKRSVRSIYKTIYKTKSTIKMKSTIYLQTKCTNG